MRPISAAPGPVASQPVIGGQRNITLDAGPLRAELVLRGKATPPSPEALTVVRIALAQMFKGAEVPGDQVEDEERELAWRFAGRWWSTGSGL